MLHVTEDTLIYLRSVQRAAEARERIRAAVMMKVERRKMPADRFKVMVKRTARILFAGRTSLFEFEGVCRRALRANLCMEGWRWADADHCAARIIEDALKAIGAQRPSWEEGQLHYASKYGSARASCLRCGGLISDERLNCGNGIITQYCSYECQQASAQMRLRKSGERISRADWLARCITRSDLRKAERARDCKYCGKLILNGKIDTIYCSKDCAVDGLRTVSMKTCEECGGAYKPKPKNGSTDGRRFCSVACYEKNRPPKKPRPELSCKTCGTIFYAKFPSSRQAFCSAPCNPRNRGKPVSNFRCEEV